MNWWLGYGWAANWFLPDNWFGAGGGGPPPGGGADEYIYFARHKGRR